MGNYHKTAIGKTGVEQDTRGNIKIPPPLHGFQYLDIQPTHLLKLYPLDFIHKDPFDRILIAQALAEDMILVTKDENIWKYPAVKLLW